MTNFRNYFSQVFFIVLSCTVFGQTQRIRSSPLNTRSVNPEESKVWNKAMGEKIEIVKSEL